MIKNTLWISFTLLLIAVAIWIGIYIFAIGMRKLQTAEPAVVQQVPDLPEQSASPSPPVDTTVDLSLYAIEVQNGSGIPGEAARVKKILENAGFRVDSAGNAAKYSYTQTIITTSQNVPESFIISLQAVLENEFTVSRSVEPTASEDSVVVIIGEKKKANRE